jgi:triosephosphate isomerase
MANKIVVANWKMNPENISQAKKLFSQISRNANTLKRTKVVIAPPFLFISNLKANGKKVSLGAQDSFWGRTGASTGEISTVMLKNAGVTSIILGHSERRTFGETDSVVSKKVSDVLKEGLIPIVCIGEKERDEHGNYLSFLSEQIKKSLSGVSRRNISQVIIAYEPIWAIGKTAEDAMNPHKLHEVVIFIYKTLTVLFGRELASKVVIIYGGSVESSNADDLIRNGNVKGFLVGRASLDSKGFGEILKAVDAS